MTKDSTKLVKCRLTNNKGPKTKNETRFVHFQEYELWKFFISQKYDFTVNSEEIYLWMHEREFNERKDCLEHLDWIPVHKVTLFFFLKNNGVLAPVIRFFPESEYYKVKPLFLKHFEEFVDEMHPSKTLEHVKEEKGVCLRNI